MKTKKTLTILTLVVLLAVTATTVWAAASPYLIDSYDMIDPLDPSVTWPRDTTNQNAIAQHSEDQFTGQAYQIYLSSRLRVLVYVSASGANTTAIVGWDNFFIVGPGGGKMEAFYASAAIKNLYVGIVGSTLSGVIYTGATPEETWGTEYWRNSYYVYPLARVYASASYPEPNAALWAVNDAITARKDSAYGRQLAWGPDGFLGLGTMKNYSPDVRLPWYSTPTNLVSEETTLAVGSVPVTLIPSSESDGGMIVWLPEQRILVGADFGQYLPDAGSINQPSVSIPERIDALNQIMNLEPVQVVPVHGMYISGNDNVDTALTAQRDALQSIYDQTLVRINAGDTIDEAAAAVTLPADLAASPYNQEFVSTVPGIVRNLYQEKMGWFSGNIIDLASTLTETVKAQTLSAAFDYPSLAEAAKQAELSAQDLPAAEKALYLAFMAYKASPDDFTVKQIYAQALRKNAFLQKSAQIRNYYLTAAQDLGTEQVVTDFTKTGDEDAVIVFTAAEFSEHFNGISGALLTTVKIDSLPENGALILPGTDESGNSIAVPVTEGQEIPLADLDGLVFTPVTDWNGSTSFLWNGKDGTGYATNDATITLILNPVNDAPLVSAAPLADVTVDEDALPITIDLSTGFGDVDIDPNGDVLAYTATSSNPDAVSVSIDGANLTLTYQVNWNGSATISVSATDLEGLAATDDFIVTVNPVNDAPTAADAEITVIAGKSQTITLDYGDLETAQANLQVTFGSLNGTLDTSALPDLTYTAPATDGDDSFTYTITDRGDPDGCSAAPCSAPLSATATVQVTVLPAPSGSISGMVFDDANASGLLDAGEIGLAGVVVQLQDADGAQLETFTTDADGAYTFTGLEAGSYQVYAPRDADRVQTTDNPIAVTLATSDEARTGVNIGSVVSADLKVSMTYSVNSKKIIFSITVTNDGPADALEAALTDILPDSVAFVSVISSQGTCSGGKTVNCSFGTIASGGSVTVTLQVNRVSTKVAVVNTATVSSSIFDIDMADNAITVTIP